MNDEQIIELYFSRDEDAIAVTTEKYGRLLYGIAKNITGSDGDAEECVSDTYLAAWDQIPPDRPEHFAAYLCAIVRNKALNRSDQNHAQKRSAVLTELTEEIAGILTDDPAQRIETERLGILIDQFLRSLEKDARMIFVRRYFYADPIPEIARMTGLRENAVSARLLRMKKKLKSHLRKENYDFDAK